MSRPKPTVLMSAAKGSNQTLEVCESTAIYAVYYQGHPIKIRTRQKDMYDGFKYGKSSFPEPGHAINLALRLNQMFNTTEFTVVELKIGRVIKMV